MDFSFYPNINTRVMGFGGVKKTAFNKKLLEKAEQSWNMMYPEELMRLEQEIPYALEICNSLVTPTAICIYQSHTFTVVPVRDVIWFYGHILKQSTTFIPTPKIHTLYVIDRYGHQFSMGQTTTVALSKKTPADEAIAKIQNLLFPYRRGIVFGYSEEFANIVSNNLPYAAQIVDANSQ